MPKKNQETEVSTKSSGIRSAVRSGELSPELALHRLEENKKNGIFVGEDIIIWLNRRKKMMKSKPVPEPVGE